MICYQIDHDVVIVALCKSGWDGEPAMSTTTMREIHQDATRKRRYSTDPARRRWYAASRALRFRRRYFATP
jgi:hypothetical protein